MADVAINADAANIPAVNFGVQGSDPTAPGAGRCLLYVKSGGVYVRYNGGSPTLVGASPALTEGHLGIGDASNLLSSMAAGTEGQVVTADASGHATWDDLPAAEGGDYASPVQSWAIFYTGSSGSAITRAINANQYFNFYVYRAIPAQNDTIYYDTYLAAGTWKLTLVYVKNASFGIAALDLSGTSLGTLDFYASAPTWNSMSTISDIVVGTAGIKRLTYTMSDKNASSSGYGHGLTMMLWERTT